MNKAEFKKLMNEICPNELAESWDNCGYQINLGDDEIKGILIALETSVEVIDEAIKNNCNLILTHHPLIFTPIKSIESGQYVDDMIIKAVKNGISVYSCHTSFDKLLGGNNDDLGEVLGFKNITEFTYGGEGFCRKGNLDKEITLRELRTLAAEALGIDESFISTVGDLDNIIKNAGWCTGSGGEFLDAAVSENLDLFITGDFKYHSAQAAKYMGISVLDLGHYGSEKIFSENMHGKIKDKIDCPVIISEIDLNPFTC